MSRPRVVLTDDTIHPAGAERLAPTCDLTILKGEYPSEEKLCEVCEEADAVFARMAVMTRKVIESARRLKIIARHGIGVDAVDMEAATARGIMVTTTGSANSNAVAEYTIGLLFGLTRKIVMADNSMRNGEWTRGPLIGPELAGKTIGIVGLGSIGSIVARQAHGLGMKVLAQDPDPKKAARAGEHVEMTSREDLLARSDFVSLHMRLEDGTFHTINADSFAQMKPTALILNTARGELIEEKAIVAALQEGKIAGAALDVFEVEPLQKDSPLRSMPNVLLSPHVAGQTRDAMERVAIAAADAILDTIAGKTPRYVYNADGLAALAQAS